MIPEDFHLTDYTKMKGCGCKIPQRDLLNYLHNVVGHDVGQNDVSITPVGPEGSGLKLISTTDFFYPLVDDPYMMGRIGCCNVLSDLYSAGVTHCDCMLMLYAECIEIPEKDGLRQRVTQAIMQGFNDAAREVGVSVTGGQSVRGAWPLIGGVASAVCTPEQFVDPVRAVPGDVLVLTKPLGMQVCVNTHQWAARRETSEGFRQRAEQLDKILPEGLLEETFRKAARQMARMNKTAAELMHKYDAHAATDVTGFGIVGHANNLALEQKADVSIRLHTLPFLKGMVKAATEVATQFPLLQGRSAETSGGLLICLKDMETARAYCEEIERLEGYPAWIIGDVIEHDKSKEDRAFIVENPTIIEY